MTRAQKIAFLKRAIPAVGVLTRDVIGLGGLAAVIHGVALMSEPLAWIVCGCAMVAVAVLLTRRQTT